MLNDQAEKGSNYFKNRCKIRQKWTVSNYFEMRRVSTIRWHMTSMCKLEITDDVGHDVIVILNLLCKSMQSDLGFKF